MAAVDDDFLKTQGFKDSSVLMACPECGEEVEFPFTVEMLMTVSGNTIQIGARIFGDRINEQPMLDHIEEHK